MKMSRIEAQTSEGSRMKRKEPGGPWRLGADGGVDTDLFGRVRTKRVECVTTSRGSGGGVDLDDLALLSKLCQTILHASN